MVFGIELVKGQTRPEVDKLHDFKRFINNDVIWLDIEVYITQVMKAARAEMS